MNWSTFHKQRNQKIRTLEKLEHQKENLNRKVEAEVTVYDEYNEPKKIDSSKKKWIMKDKILGHQIMAIKCDIYEFELLHLGISKRTFIQRIFYLDLCKLLVREPIPEDEEEQLRTDNLKKTNHFPY